MIKKILKEINECLKECSKPNWDGYEAYPISKKSVDYAIKFLKELPKDIKKSVDMISPSPTGRMSFDWCTKECYCLSVEFFENGSLEFVVFIDKKSYTKKAKIKEIIETLRKYNERFI